MRRVAILGVVLLLFFFSPVGNQPVKAKPSVKNVIIVIWDGTQRAHLLEMLAEHKLPNLQRLINETGNLGLPVIDSKTCQPGSGDGYRTETGPANSAIATGLGYPGMANWQNRDPHPIPDDLTLWELFKAKGYATGIVSSKNGKFWPYVPLTNARPEINYWRVRGLGQKWVTDKAIQFIQNHAGRPFFLWIHYKEPDPMGHHYGENSPEYTKAIVIDDNNLGQLIKKLQELGIKNKTLIIVTTDHGFGEGARGHGMCTRDTKDLFLVTNRNGTDLLGCIHAQTDIAPCLKDLF